MIYLASDHGGYHLKKIVKTFLEQKGMAVKDLGPHHYHPDDDYPDYIIPLAELVAETDGLGVIACRNGQGAAIIANKVKGVRAAVCWSSEVAQSARIDDHANVISLPADYITEAAATEAIMHWLETAPSADARHLRRLAKVKKYEGQ